MTKESVIHRLERIYIDIPALRPGSAGAYLLAMALAVVATLLRVAIDPLVEGVQYITFFPAVIVCSLISGMRAGFLCVLLSAVGAWLFVLAPVGAIVVNDWQQVTTIAFFLFVASTNVLFIGAMRIAIQRYRDLAKTMERRVQERTEELMRTQQTLAHSQKMDAIGKLTGGVAHDFNNMLAVIMASLDLMKRRLMAGQTDVMRYVDSATEGVERAAQLTSRLLAFARKQPLAPEDVDVNKLMQNLSELLHRTLGETIALEYVGAAGLWRSHVDPAELERAIVNLAVNARDAMPDGGALTIETANAYLDEHYASSHAEVTAGQYVMISVSDKGMGMSPEVAARAMDPFFTTKDPTKGTGLGLSQVYGFVKQSNGHIAIYSEEGHGTTVRVYLPRAYVDAAAAPAEGDASAVALPAGSAEVTVLVVEDDAQVRRSTVVALQELGYRVREADGGAAALALIDEDPTIELLFTDVVMPVMDGRRLAEAAAARRPALKVLYTTGYSQNAIIHDGRLDPGVSLLVKPFTVDQLSRKLRATLEEKGRRRRSAAD